MLTTLHSNLERLTRIAVWAGGFALLASAIMVSIDVVSRKLLGTSLVIGANEITGYTLSVTTAWAYSFCLMHRSNVRIDVLYGFLPRPVTGILDLIGVLAMLCLVSVMTYYGALAWHESWTQGARSISSLQTPIWIPQGLWVIGLLLFLFTTAFITFYTLIALLQRNWALVGRIAGIPSVSEAIEEETHGMDQQLK